MINIIAAILVIILFIGMIIFQFLLVLGLPLGYLAYGAKHKELPTNLRIMSVVAIGIFIYGLMVILDTVDIVNIFSNPMVYLISVCILVVYFTFGALMNMMSRSKWEKRIMSPIAVLIAICCYLVAILS